MWESWVQSLAWEDPLEEGIATHSSILAWRIAWTEEPGGVQSMGSPRVRHDWVTKHTSPRKLSCNPYRGLRSFPSVFGTQTFSVESVLAIVPIMPPLLASPRGVATGVSPDSPLPGEGRVAVVSSVHLARGLAISCLAGCGRIVEFFKCTAFSLLQLPHIYLCLCPPCPHHPPPTAPNLCGWNPDTLESIAFFCWVVSYTKVIGLLQVARYRRQVFWMETLGTPLVYKEFILGYSLCIQVSLPPDSSGWSNSVNDLPVLLKCHGQLS